MNIKKKQRHLNDNLISLVQTLKWLITIHPEQRFIFAGCFSDSGFRRYFSSDLDLSNRLVTFVDEENARGITNSRVQEPIDPDMIPDYTDRLNNSNLEDATYEKAFNMFTSIPTKASRYLYPRWKDLIEKDCLKNQKKDKDGIINMFGCLFRIGSSVNARTLWDRLNDFSDVQMAQCTTTQYILIMKTLDVLAKARGEVSLPDTTTRGRTLAPPVFFGPENNPDPIEAVVDYDQLTSQPACSRESIIPSVTVPIANDLDDFDFDSNEGDALYQQLLEDVSMEEDVTEDSISGNF